MPADRLRDRAQCDCGSRTFVIMENVGGGLTARCTQCERMGIGTGEDWTAEDFVEVPEYVR